jgi:hypothetical protein
MNGEKKLGSEKELEPEEEKELEPEEEKEIEEHECVRECPTAPCTICGGDAPYREPDAKEPEPGRNEECDKCGVLYDAEKEHYCDPDDESNEIECLKIIQRD